MSETKTRIPHHDAVSYKFHRKDNPTVNDRSVFAGQTVDLIDEKTFEKRAKIGRDKIKRLPIGSNFLVDNPGHHTVLKTDNDVAGLLDDLSKAAPIIL